MSKDQNIQDQVKSFEDACKVLGISTALPEVGMLPEKHQKAIVAHYKLITICEALNEGWKPNWNDWDEYKYIPWPEVKASADKPSGFGFSDSYCGSTYAHTFVGSRLCFKSSELALYALEQFKELYIEYFLLKD